MKKFKIPKIIRRLELSEYAPEYEGHYFDVFVNPSRDKRVDFFANVRESELLTERVKMLGMKPEDAPDDWKPNREEIDKITAALVRMNEAILGWWAYVWSQGENEADHCTVDEVRAFLDECRESDVGLWLFVTQKTSEMILNHAAGVKKK